MQEERKISAGSYDLNKFLYGGYEKDIITTIYGPAGSGKTNLCMIAASSQAKKGNKILYIDTEGGFSLDRFKQLDENYKENIQNIILLKPTSFQEQIKVFETLDKELKKSRVTLIIVDGMTMLYRLELAESRDIEKIRETNKELASQMRILAEISRMKNIPVVITNQVYKEFLCKDDLEKGITPEIKMVGGDILKYWSKCLIELKLDKGKRKIILKKHRSLPEKELSFVIANQGIRKRGLF